MSGRFQFSLSLPDAWHIAQRMRVIDREEIEATSPPMTDAERANALVDARGTKFTVWSHDNEPVVMGGWMPLWPGVVSSWLVASDRITEVGPSLDHAALKGHKMLFDSGVHRCQAFGLPKHETSRSWLLQLGYRPEGVHHQFGVHRETFICYAKTRKAAA